MMLFIIVVEDGLSVSNRNIVLVSRLLFVFKLFN